MQPSSDSGRTLLTRLLDAGIESEEVAVFLADRFKSSAHASGSNEVTYPKDPPHAVTLFYDKYGTLESVQAEGLAESEILDLLRHLKEDFIGQTHNAIATAILFCDAAPVEGHWRYKDEFQILPAPSAAPRPHYLCAQHPFLMEFRHTVTNNRAVNDLRLQRRPLELTRLLNAFLNREVWLNQNRHIGTLDNMWVALPGGLEKGKWEVAYCQRMYTIDGLTCDPNDFSPLESLPPLAEIPAQKYYTERPHAAEALAVPSDLSACFDRFFLLPKELQEKYRQACYWLGEIRNCRSFSLRLITAVQAIESLIVPALARGRCASCNREIRDGPTKQFQSFLEQYAPFQGEDTGVRKALYETRSGLTHGYRPPFLVDTEVDSSLNPLSTIEWHRLDNAERVVRIAMRNWLCHDVPQVQDAEKVVKKHFSVSATVGGG